MKKHLIVLLASTGILGSVAFGTAQAFAAFPNTDVTIGFEGDNSTNPLPDPTGNSLELLSVPRMFDFGQTNTVGEGIEVNLKNKTDSYVALRDGDKSRTNPWHLTASMSELKQGSDTLPAELTIETEGELLDFDYTPGKTIPTPNATNTHVNKELAADFATDNKITVKTGGSEQKIVSSNYKDDSINSSRAVKIKNASLKIAKDNAKYEYAGKEFSGSVTWMLSVAP
ncbi:hypothetical protein [Candidatus Enterococcus ferrettii]|uniref:WxL domain-containing protein n=1 Tax=Candidatus Enterococcus ferrettii TaxID=2815324 RepID=A0ABV0EP46_9ENTE